MFPLILEKINDVFCIDDGDFNDGSRDEHKLFLLFRLKNVINQIHILERGWLTIEIWHIKFEMWHRKNIFITDFSLLQESFSCYFTKNNVYWISYSYFIYFPMRSEFYWFIIVSAVYLNSNWWMPFSIFTVVKADKILWKLYLNFFLTETAEIYNNWIDE